MSNDVTAIFWDISTCYIWCIINTVSLMHTLTSGIGQHCFHVAVQVLAVLYMILVHGIASEWRVCSIKHV